MKRYLALALALLMIATALVGCNEEPVDDQTQNDEAAVEEIFYVGFARESITPNGSHNLAGYAHTRMSQGVLDELSVSCTAVKDSKGVTALICSIDVEHISTATYTLLKDSILGVLPDITPENIIFNATHTHYAPNPTNNKEFIEKMMEGSMAAAQKAMEDLTEAEIYYGTNIAKDLNQVRRGLYDENGNPIEQVADYNMPVIKFVREGKKDVVLINWAAHADTRGVSYMSADYVHYVRSTVEAKHDVYLSVQMSAGGNINPTNFDTEAYGSELGYDIIKFLNHDENFTKMTSTRGISSIVKNVELTVNHENADLYEEIFRVEAAWEANDTELAYELLEDLGMSIYEALGIARTARSDLYQYIDISVISIGEIAIVVAPYEMYTQPCQNIKSTSPFEHTFVCATSNGFLAYVPIDEAYNTPDAYEVSIAKFVRGTSELLENEYISMLGELHEMTDSTEKTE